MTILGLDKHAAGCKPGSLCTHKGTGTGRKPGTQSAGGQALSASDAGKRETYLHYALTVSYAMDGKAEKQKLQQDVLGGNGRVQSGLGGAMLRMYLSGKKNADTIAKAGKEIGEDEQFHTLVVKEMSDYLQAQVARGTLHRTDTSRMKVLADQHLKAIKHHRGIDLRKHLNAVIGGVGSIAVDSVTHVGDAPTAKGTVATYRADIHIGDTYNFHGHRTGDQARLRTKLAQYLKARNYDKFEETYNNEASFGLGGAYGYIPLPHFGTRATHLDDAGTFACFMYALEDIGWTRPLEWDVVVVVDFTLIFAPVHETAAHSTLHHKGAHASGGHK